MRLPFNGGPWPPHCDRPLTSRKWHLLTRAVVACRKFHLLFSCLSWTLTLALSAVMALALANAGSTPGAGTPVGSVVRA